MWDGWNEDYILRDSARITLFQETYYCNSNILKATARNLIRERKEEEPKNDMQQKHYATWWHTASMYKVGLNTIVNPGSLYIFLPACQ